MPEYNERMDEQAVALPEPDEGLLDAAREADENAGTDDSVPDGTQPDGEIDATLVEEGDAGVNDTGDEEWYQDGDA